MMEESLIMMAKPCLGVVFLCGVPCEHVTLCEEKHVQFLERVSHDLDLETAEAELDAELAVLDPQRAPMTPAETPEAAQKRIDEAPPARARKWKVVTSAVAGEHVVTQSAAGNVECSCAVWRVKQKQCLHIKAIKRLIVVGAAGSTQYGFPIIEEMAESPDIQKAVIATSLDEIKAGAAWRF